MEQNDFKTTQMDSRDRLRNLYFLLGDAIAGRYEFVRELGHGGMGRVYLCRDTMANGRLMAVKTVPDILRDDHDAVAMLQREYDNMFNLTNDGIVAVRNLVKDDFRYYVVMDYAEGETLEAYLKRVRKPDSSVTLEVARRLAAALDYAHGKGLVHRDVKPGNVMVQIDGNDVKSVKLLDFGLGLHIRESVSHVSGVMTSGTPAYKSPEQWRPDLYDNKLTKQSDQYSLAALIYEMLAEAGHYPFHNYDLATFPNAVLTVPPKRLDNQPNHVNDALQKALAKKPEDRFENCTAFVTAMEKKPEARQMVQPVKTLESPKTNVSPMASQQMEPKPQLASNAMKTEGKKSKRWTWIVAFVVLIGVLALIAGLSAESSSENNVLRKSEKPSPQSSVIIPPQSVITPQQSREDVVTPLPRPVIVAKLVADEKKTSEKQLEEEKKKTAELAAKVAAGEEAKGTVTERKNQEGNLTLMLSGNVPLKLVHIHAGSFMMGSPTSESGRIDNEIQHRVTLTKDFWLGETEVTQEQYRAVMGSNPSRFSKGGKYPVEYVSWTDAMAFCERLTKAERDNGNLPDGYEYTLPTEAQWEYACRAGTTTPFNFGSTLNGDKANCNGNCPYGMDEGKYVDATTEVGKYGANAWGLYDMHGNVWEWCRDWYDGYPSGSVTDPVGPSSGSYRVLRGGSWISLAWACRSAIRSSIDPSRRGHIYGFRVALASVQ